MTFATLGVQTLTAADSSDSSINGSATTNVGNDAGGFGGFGGFFGRFRRGDLASAVDALIGSENDCLTSNSS